MTPPQLVPCHDPEITYTSETTSTLSLVKPEPDSQPYYCTAEYHLQQMSRLALAIHPFALHISKGHGGLFSASATKLSGYFKCNVSSTRRGIKDLVDGGMFELVRPGICTPNVYRVLKHEDWTKKHPGKCAEKFEQVWGDEGDKLGQYLSLRTGFTAKMIEYQMNNLRSLNLPDEEVIARFDEYYEKTGKWQESKNVMVGFYIWLKGLKTTR
jgi:hypothetical protein